MTPLTKPGFRTRSFFWLSAAVAGEIALPWLLSRAARLAERRDVGDCAGGAGRVATILKLGPADLIGVARVRPASAESV